MCRKRKITKKHSAQKTKPIILSEDNDEQCGSSQNKKNNLANISHKKSHGSNNWQIFKESLMNLKDPKVNITKNIKTKNFNKTNKIVHKQVKDNSKIYSKYKSNNLSQVSIPNKSNLNNVKSSEDKSVISGDKHVVGKHSEAKEKPLTRRIAMDCEMVGVELGVKKNMLARISLVNSFGDCVYDKFVKPTEPVIDYRTRFSGVRPRDLENAEDFKTVQKEVAEILKGRILIGHALKNDLKVLLLSHPKQAIRDTSKFKKFREGRTPSLKNLALKYLGASIQVGEHSSVQDALAAMQLYQMFKKEWENKSRKPCVSKSIRETDDPKLMANSLPDF